MTAGSAFQLLADLVLIAHVGLVVFIAGGLVLIVVGNRRGWQGVNALWFRLAHLAAILVVVAESWLQFVCPLTTLEMYLRARSDAGAAGGRYAGSFIEHWLQQLLYFNAPWWAFAAAYSLFAALVLASWLVFPPHWRARPRPALLENSVRQPRPPPHEES